MLPPILPKPIIPTCIASSALATVQSRLDRVEEGLDAERDVADRAVHEESRRAAHPAAPAALHLLANSLQVDVVVHLRRVARHVETDSLGIAVQVLESEMRLIGEQEL